MSSEEASVRRGRPRTDALRLKSIRVLGDYGFCSSGAAEDGRAPTEEHSCVRGWWLLFVGAAEDEDLGQPPLQKGREFSLSPDHGVIVV